MLLTHTHTQHTTVLLLFWSMSGTTRVSRYQKGKTRKVKTNLDLLEQEIVSGSGICWAIICTSAPHPRQPHQHPTTHFFYRPDALLPFLPPNQQRQSTEGMLLNVRYVNDLCYLNDKWHCCKSAIYPRHYIHGYILQPAIVGVCTLLVNLSILMLATLLLILNSNYHCHIHQSLQTWLLSFFFLQLTWVSERSHC